MSMTHASLPDADPGQAFDPFERAGFDGHPATLAIQGVPSAGQAFRNVLNQDERERLARLVSPARRAELEMSLHLRRCLVSGLTGTDPRQVLLSNLQDGAPHLVEPEGWAISLSHKAPWTVAAATRAPSEIGVDVEIVREIAWRPMLKMICDDLEREAFESLASDEQVARSYFFRMWTIKEAVLKSTAQGFRAGPKAVPAPLPIVAAPGAGWLSAFGNIYEFWTTDLGDAIFSLARKRV